MKADAPGALVQVDHKSISFTEGRMVKEFKAVCPVSKWCVLRVCSRAAIDHARRFSETLRREAPFPIRSLQVDGGPEFCDEFEQACQDLAIPLYVLLPKKPEHNGCVARANGAGRYEFYPFYDGLLTVDAINREPADHQVHYGACRP